MKVKNMIDHNEHGRSMIEMLGVLAVVGMISVGSISVISGAMQSQRYTQAITDAAQLADEGRHLACDYRDDTGYSGVAYGIFLYKSGRYPSSLSYDGDGVYSGVLDITYTVATIDASGAFSIAIDNVPQELCIKMLSNDWGNSALSGLTAIKYGTETTALSLPVGLDTAATKCASDSNSITLEYAGCGYYETPAEP